MEFVQLRDDPEPAPDPVPEFLEQCIDNNGLWTCELPFEFTYCDNEGGERISGHWFRFRKLAKQSGYRAQHRYVEGEWYIRVLRDDRNFLQKLMDWGTE